MNAAGMNWRERVTDRLTPAEWPDGVLEQMDPAPVLALSDLRDTVGQPAMPSPLPGAHVRDSGDGMHSTRGGERLSTATDFFCRWPAAWAYLAAARRHPAIRGIGIYTDMVFRATAEGTFAMLHIDTGPRDEVWEWVGWRESRRHRLKYVYLNTGPVEYHRILGARARNR